MIRTLTLCFALAAAAACGGKSAPATSTTTQPSGTGGPGEHEMHANMPPEMAKLHDVLAPRWHAEQGPQRITDTCASVPDFTAAADALAKATPPTTANADTWTAGTRALVDAVANLATTCKANDTAKFDEAFGTVHESFHALMAAAGMHHDEAGTGEHAHGDHQGGAQGEHAHGEHAHGEHQH